MKIPAVAAPDWVKNNKLTVSILLFLILFSAVNYIKPGILYNEYGELRPFGIGYSHKTVLPIWVVSIILAVFSYLIVRMLLHDS